MNLIVQKGSNHILVCYTQSWNERKNVITCASCSWVEAISLVTRVAGTRVTTNSVRHMWRQHDSRHLMLHTRQYLMKEDIKVKIVV